ncbi:MAG TPA: Clp protease N-terminal domain-containing protein [Hyphomicrobiaceae bacterium]|nr:Clp protease N-terminal domain-containing protein [Hyphomicrobiaceae bacterium]
MSPNLSQSFGRAQEFAREQAHRALLLEHLLLALTEDPEASGVLRACKVDTVRLSTDVSGYLGRLMDDMRAAPGTEPVPDNELLRVIEAARQAAQQSRRRAIDGAIVLAAIVGDGKSPAAGLLKAHGMTFDEAIKTLQKASAQARSQQYSSANGAPPTGQPSHHAAPPPPASIASAPVSREPPPAPEKPASVGPAAGQAAPPGQSVDDILAAARARIQQRNAGTAPPTRPEPPLPQASAPPEAPPKATEPELPLMNLSNYTAASAPPPPDMPDLPPRIARAPSGLGLSPTRPGTSPAPPLPGGSPPRPPEPSLSGPRTFQRADDEGPRPPPSLRSDRPLRNDWPDEPTQPSLRPTAANPPPPAAGPRPQMAEPSRPPTRRPGMPPAARGQRPAAGPLMEAIPRRMRVGSAASAQVRISRDKIDSLMQLLAAGRALPHPEGAIAHMLTVRLVSTEDGFAIDPETPETQWIDLANSGQVPEDHLGWRWAVTPQRRGRQRLQLIVKARTLTRDGIGPEMAPPDRIIEVAVRRNRLRGLVRLFGFIVLLAFGVGAGRLSHDKLAQDLVDVFTALWRNVLGLLVTSGFVSGG